VSRQGTLKKDLNFVQMSFEMALQRKIEYLLKKDTHHFVYNHRFFDFMHTLKGNYNYHNLHRLLDETIHYYFRFPECWRCSIDQPPRPNLCGCKDPGSKTSEICHLYVHFRGTAGIKKAPIVETRTDPRKPWTIKLSRPSIRLMLDLELDFIFRTAEWFPGIMHHLIDYMDDSKGAIALVDPLWHQSHHRKMEACEKRIDTLERCIRSENDSIKKQVYIIKLSRERELLTKLQIVSHDPQLLRLVYEINDRVKLVESTGDISYFYPMDFEIPTRMSKPEQTLMQYLAVWYPRSYIFTGNGHGKQIIGGKKPDFTWEKKKICIDINGGTGFIHGKDHPMLIEDQRRIAAFREFGYHMLVVWEHELKDPESLKQRIDQFHEAIG